MTPTIGRIVHYRRPATAAAASGADGDYHEAAIITMTPQEWTPGYRGDDGEWVATTNVSEPKVGTVHLHVFSPPGATGEQSDVTDVPEGTGPGTWSWPPVVK